MPVVMRIAGYCVVIFSNDHRPPHVHIIGADGQAVVSLETAPCLLRLEGMSDREGLKLAKAISPHVQTLLKEWEAIHDNR